MEKAMAIKSLYSQRDNFVLIGLTGRSGSGCTTVSGILKKERIEDLDLRSYKTCDYNNAEERKYSILYRFMKASSRWKAFTVIEASSVIFSYVLEGTYKRLFDFLDVLAQDGEIRDIETLKRDIVNALREKPLTDGESINSVENEVIDGAICEIFRKCDDEDEDETDDVSKNKKAEKIIKYFTDTVKKKKAKFREVLIGCTIEKITKDENSEKKIYNLYTKFMQVIGNNIRSSGKYDDKEEIPGMEITVAKKIDDIIQVIRKRDEELNSNQPRTRICIDALRNSVEIQYFRDKYRAFYAVAVNTDDKHRQNRLGMNKKELQGLDEIEYPGVESVFYHQNIQACLEIADIYLYNPNVRKHKFFFLTEQLIKYIALILQPGLIAPTHMERCMQLAFNAKYNSGCLSRQVGAVITGEDFSVRAVGWNDVPKGQVPCNLRCVEDYCRNKDEETFSEYELNEEMFHEVMHKTNVLLQEEKVKANKEGRCYAYCFKDVYNGITGKSNQVHTRALHAEENAFLQISKYGGAKIQGGKLFTTASPCELCAKKAYQLGIKEIYYIDPYPGISKTHILTFGKSGNPEMIFFQGAIGNAYISLYAPRMPYKDEIQLITDIKIKDEATKVYKSHNCD